MSFDLLNVMGRDDLITGGGQMQAVIELYRVAGVVETGLAVGGV